MGKLIRERWVVGFILLSGIFWRYSGREDLSKNYELPGLHIVALTTQSKRSYIPKKAILRSEGIQFQVRFDHPVR